MKGIESNSKTSIVLTYQSKGFLKFALTNFYYIPFFLLLYWIASFLTIGVGFLLSGAMDSIINQYPTIGNVILIIISAILGVSLFIGITYLGHVWYRFFDKEREVIIDQDGIMSRVDEKIIKMKWRDVKKIEMKFDPGDDSSPASSSINFFGSEDKILISVPDHIYGIDNIRRAEGLIKLNSKQYNIPIKKPII